MMKLKLDLPYTVDEGDRQNPAFKTDTAITISLLRTAMNSTKGQQQGGHKDRTALRVAAKVTNAITKVANAKANELELDMIQLKFLKDALSEWMTSVGVPAPLVGWYEELMTAVEKLVETGEKEVEAKKNGASAPATEPAKASA